MAQLVRRLARALACCCVAVAAVVVLVPAPSGAAGPQAVGWWSRQLPFQSDADAEGAVTGQSVAGAVRFSPARPAQVPPLPVETTVPGSGPVTTAPLPAEPPELPESPITTPDSGEGTPNPGVPEGGLWVANDLTGPAAISALRFRGDIGSGELSLTFAPGSTVVGPVVACPALSDWTPGGAGAWRDRPAHDCDTLQLSGRLSPDGTQLTFAIPQGFMPFAERELDIVILPKPGAGDVFSLYFEAPGEDSFEVFAGQELPPPAATFPEPDPATLPTTAPPAPAFSPDAGGGAPAATSPTDQATDEVATPEVVEIGGGTGGIPQPVAQVFEPLTESRAARVFAVTLLLMMGLGLWWLGGQPVRQPRLLGALAGGDHPGHAHPPEPADEGRGIGRFRRTRAAPPTRL